jgi:hypothetical protein
MESYESKRRREPHFGATIGTVDRGDGKQLVVSHGNVRNGTDGLFLRLVSGEDGYVVSYLGIPLACVDEVTDLMRRAAFDAAKRQDILKRFENAGCTIDRSRRP